MVRQSEYGPSGTQHVSCMKTSVKSSLGAVCTYIEIRSGQNKCICVLHGEAHGCSPSSMHQPFHLYWLIGRMILDFDPWPSKARTIRRNLEIATFLKCEVEGLPFAFSISTILPSPLPELVYITLPANAIFFLLPCYL